MSIKDLFGKKSNQIVSSESLKETVDRNIESVDYAEQHVVEKRRFIPRVDFSDPKSFARYGSASKYYSDAIQTIYQSYPYDGSYAEKKDWHSRATYIDNWFFENQYPRFVGHVKLNDIKLHPFASANVLGDGRNYMTLTDPQYIALKGGPHRTLINDTGNREQIDHGISGADVNKEFPFKLGKANIWNPKEMRDSNLYMSGELGNTVEFWWRKDQPKRLGTVCLFDMWNQEPHGSTEYGRILIEHDEQVLAATGDYFHVTYAHGTNGVERQPVGNLNDVPNDYNPWAWNHYAYTCVNEGGELRVRFYLNGKLITDGLAGTAIDVVQQHPDKASAAFIGAYQNRPVSSILAIKWGPTGEGNVAVQASYDEFRYWKQARTSEEVGRHWFTQVGGGTNTDDANVMLGVYYKFNEGIVDAENKDSQYDKNVLDYSGRISNGTIQNYNIRTRSLESAMESFSTKHKEFKDPVLYPAHPEVAELLRTKKDEGFVHDTSNNAAIYHTMPEWITSEDEELGGEALLDLTQVIASYFDTLHLQIEALPCLTNTKYVQDDEKPLPFASHLLESVGFVAPEIFIDASLLETMAHRDETQNFEEKVYNVKNTIYQNIYNNIAGIYKAKGTEKSFRNLLHCFGIGDELIKINLYGSDVVFKFDDTYRHVAARKNYLDYNNVDRFDSSVFQKRNPDNPNSTSYIRGSDTSEFDYIPFTLEVESVFPRVLDNDHPNYDRHNFTNISIFGMHEAYALDEDVLNWQPSKACDFEVFAIREEIDGEERKNVKFKLRAQGFGGFELETGFYPEVYNNEQWNFAVRIYQNKRPLTDLVLGSEFAGDPPVDEEYTFEFYGVNTVLGDVQEEFLLTQAVAATDAKSALNAYKRIYVGAHYRDFGPDHTNPEPLMQTDIKIGSVRYWADYLDSDTIQDHARDTTNWGRKRPYKPAYFAEGVLDTYHVPQIETLVLHWDFATVTVADGGDPTVNTILSDAGFWVEDVSSGSLDKTLPGGKYDWLGKVTEYQHTARGDYYYPNDKEVIDRDYVYTSRQHLPEIIHSSDTINILRQDDDVFTKESKAINHFWAIEKSMYQNISEEQLEMFASIVEFNNLVGEGVNRYRMEYKDLGKLRHIFFAKIDNVPRFERYVEFYKWIDSSISAMLQELIPASANFSDELRTLIESHILERNKYWNKYPTLEMKDKPPEVPILGINEMLYNWKHGRAALEEKKNCLWWNLRTERNHPLLTTGYDDIDADKNQLLHAYQTIDSGSWEDRRFAHGTNSYNMESYQASTFVLRNLSKPYKFSVDENVPIHGGRNYPQNKKLHYVRTETPFASEGTVCLEDANQVAGFDCLDDYESEYTMKRRLAFAAANKKYREGTEENQAKGTLLSPFDLYADVADDDAHTGRYWGNVHSDTYGDDMETPMQGVFTDTHVGGLQYRHIVFNHGDDDQTTRPEAWLFDAETGCFIGPDQISVHNPRARYYRDEKAKRPVNIRNVKTTLENPILGNFRFLYEFSQTVSRKKNNSWFTKIEGIPAHDVWSVQSKVVKGHYDFELPIRQLHPDGEQTHKQYGREWVEEWKALRADPHLYKHRHVFVERFSAPGSPHTIPRGMMDVEAEEFSPHNQLNFRNLDVRVHLKRWLTHHARWGGYRSWYRQRPVLDCWDIKTNPDDVWGADWNPLLDPNPGSPGDTGVFCAANYHKMNRNVKYVFRPTEYFDLSAAKGYWAEQYDEDCSDCGDNDCDPDVVYPPGHPCCLPYWFPIKVKYVCKETFDNWWQQHQVPQSGYQYSWIKDSVLPVDCPQGYAEPFTNMRAEYPTIVVDPDDPEYGLMPEAKPFDNTTFPSDYTDPPLKGERAGPIKEDPYWKISLIDGSYIENNHDNWALGHFTLRGSSLDSTVQEYTLAQYSISVGVTLLDNLWDDSKLVIESGFPFMRVFKRWDEKHHPYSYENVITNTELGYCEYSWAGVNMLGDNLSNSAAWKKYDQYYHPTKQQLINVSESPAGEPTYKLVNLPDFILDDEGNIVPNITDPHADVISQYTAGSVNNVSYSNGGVYSAALNCDLIEDQLNDAYVPSLSFNDLMLHRNGPYQHPSWKQIRGHEHPITRFHRNNNIISMLDHTRAMDFVYKIDPRKDGTEQERRLVFRERRSDSVTNYVEPCAAWNMPMTHRLGFPGSRVGGRLKHTFSNNLEMFANPFLTQRLSLVKCDKQMYDTLLEQYMDSEASTSPKFFGMVYKEYIFPKHRNVGLAKIRSRLNYKEVSGYGVNGYDKRVSEIRNFWHTDANDRKRTELKSKSGAVTHPTEWAYNFAVDTNNTTALNCFNYPVRRSSVWALDYHKYWDEDIGVRLGAAGNGEDLAQFCPSNLPPEMAGVKTKILLNRAKSVRVMRGDLGWAGFAQFRGYVYDGTNTNPDFNEGNGHYSPDWYSDTCLGFYTRLDLSLIDQECNKYQIEDPQNGKWHDIPAPCLPLLDPETGQPVEGESDTKDSCCCPVKEYQEWMAPRPTPQYIHNPQSCKATEEGWAWNTAALSGKAPWYDSYEEYNKDIRLIGQNYSILPEFRISSNMKYYVNEMGGDFRSENKKMFETIGTFTRIGGQQPEAPETSGETYTQYQSYHSYDGINFLQDDFENLVSGYTYEINWAAGFESFNNGEMANTIILDNCLQEQPVPLDAVATNWKCAVAQPITKLNTILKLKDAKMFYGEDTEELKNSYSFFDHHEATAPHQRQGGEGEFMKVSLGDTGLQYNNLQGDVDCYFSYVKLFDTYPEIPGEGIPIGGAPSLAEIRGNFDGTGDTDTDYGECLDLDGYELSPPDITSAIRNAYHEAKGESCFTLSFWVNVDHDGWRQAENQSMGGFTFSYEGPPSEQDLTNLFKPMAAIRDIEGLIGDADLEQQPELSELENRANKQGQLNIVDDRNLPDSLNKPEGEQDGATPKYGMDKRLSFYLKDFYDNPAQGDSHQFIDLVSNPNALSGRPMLVDDCGNKLHFDIELHDGSLHGTWQHIVMVYIGGSNEKMGKSGPTVSTTNAGDPAWINSHKAFLFVNGKQIPSHHAYHEMLGQDTHSPFPAARTSIPNAIKHNGALFHNVKSWAAQGSSGHNQVPHDITKQPEDFEFQSFDLINNFTFGKCIKFENPMEKDRHTLRGYVQNPVHPQTGPVYIRKTSAFEPDAVLRGKVNDVSLYTGGFVDLEPANLTDMINFASMTLQEGSTSTGCAFNTPGKETFDVNSEAHLSELEECVRKAAFNSIINPALPAGSTDTPVESIFAIHHYGEQCENLNDVYAEWAKKMNCSESGTTEMVTPTGRTIVDDDVPDGIVNDELDHQFFVRPPDARVHYLNLRTISEIDKTNYLQKKIYRPYDNCAKMSGWWKMGIPVWERELCETTVWKEDFFKCYGHTDAIQHIDKVYEDHRELGIDAYPRLTLKINAIKKLLPYNGFYPSQRTVQLASLFYDSISPYVVGENDEQAYERARTLQAMTQPFFAPGILYNTIKSGIAVDWACYAGEHDGTSNDMRDRFLDRYYEVVWCCTENCDDDLPSCSEVASGELSTAGPVRGVISDANLSHVNNIVAAATVEMMKILAARGQVADKGKLTEEAQRELSGLLIDRFASGALDPAKVDPRQVIEGFGRAFDGASPEDIKNEVREMASMSVAPSRSDNPEVELRLVNDAGCEGAFLGEAPNFRIPFEGLVSIDSVLPLQNSQELSKIFLLAPSYYAERFEPTLDTAMFSLPDDAPPNSTISGIAGEPDENLRYPYFEWLGRKNPLYEMAMHNFLAEVPNFFLKRKGFTTFASQPEKDFKTVTSGTMYYMDVQLYVTEDFAMTSSPHDGEACQVLDGAGSQVLDASGKPFTTEGRYFGPAVKYLENMEDQFYIGDPAQAPYVPPYFYGRAKARVIFEPTEDGRPTLDDIFKNSSIQYVNEEMDELFANKMVPPDPSLSAASLVYRNTEYRNTPAYQGRMPMEASINFFGRTKQRKITYDVVRSPYELPDVLDSIKEPYLARTAEDSDTSESSVWTISPRFECPTLNFKTEDNLRMRQYPVEATMDTLSVAVQNAGLTDLRPDQVKALNALGYSLNASLAVSLYQCTVSACAPHVGWNCEEFFEGSQELPPCGEACTTERLPHDARGIGMWSGYGQIPEAEEGIFITLEESYKRRRDMKTPIKCELSTKNHEVPTAKIIIPDVQTWKLHDSKITLTSPHGDETEITIGQPTNVYDLNGWGGFVDLWGNNSGNETEIDYYGANVFEPTYTDQNTAATSFNWFGTLGINAGPPKVVTFNTQQNFQALMVWPPASVNGGGAGGTMSTTGTGPVHRGEYDVEAYLGAEGIHTNFNHQWNWGQYAGWSQGMVQPINIAKAIAHYINGRSRLESDFCWQAEAKYSTGVTIQADAGMVEIKWVERDPDRTGTDLEPLIAIEPGSVGVPYDIQSPAAIHFVDENGKIVWNKKGGTYDFYPEETDEEYVRCIETVGSLVDVCGFQTSTERVGELADEKEISEAVVMIPFVDEPINSKTMASTVNVMGRNFFKLSKKLFNYTKKNIEAGKPAIPHEGASSEYSVEKDIPSTSVSEMITNIKKYNMPPQFDFITYPLKSGEFPFVMYIFEFHHTLDKQDLADIWQGVMPKIAVTAEKDSVVISHEMNPVEFYEAKKLPPNVRWLTFKVKRKANIDYYSVTADSRDDDRFKFDFEFGEAAPEYSYNWPYDFFSLVELVQVEGGVSATPAYEDIIKKSRLPIRGDTEDQLTDAHIAGQAEGTTKIGSLVDWDHVFKAVPEDED